VNKLEKRIKAIANEAGLSSEMVLAENEDSSVTYMNIW
jgi:hypothetical protein